MKQTIQINFRRVKGKGFDNNKELIFTEHVNDP